MTLLMDSPVGPIGLNGDVSSITSLDWGIAGTLPAGPLADRALAQLSEYFAGKQRDFDLPLAPRGSEFQQRFYAALCAIPYGETRTYGDLASELDVSAQAIGQACGANPIAILIPCHRVLGATSLGGFSGAGGVEAKVELLKLEGAAGLLI